MYRICKDCGTKINYSTEEIEKDIPDYCPDCNLVIAKGRYGKNIKGGKTLFATVGENLGHMVMSESILRFYREQNPDETVSLLTPVETLDISEKVSGDFDKLFWADVSNIALPPDDPRVIKYSFARECTAISKLGYYPKWQDRHDNANIKIDNDIHRLAEHNKFIIFHARKSKGNPHKNITDIEFYKILEALKDSNMILVGNDGSIYSGGVKPYLDFKNVLSLDQIAYICGHENCIATIGKDSGVLHLAAAAGSKVIGFGYQSKYWFPKSGKVECFMNTGEWQKFLACVEKLA